MKHEGETYCCTECFADPEIKAFIVSFDNLGNCNYCQSSGIHIAKVSDVCSFIRKGVERVYEVASDSIGWNTTDISEILDELDVFPARLSTTMELLDDFNFGDTPYYRRDRDGLEFNQIINWAEFCETAKRDQRFTILLDSPFVTEMARLMHQALTNLISTGTILYRARIVRNNQQFGHVDLTSPPLSIAGNNRMSPAGISFFYGAFDIETAIAEMRPSLGDTVVVGSFRVCKNLDVLDFSTIPEQTSPFSNSYDFRFEEFIRPFLERFAEDISKPIRPDDAPIDYVPTQIFMEYIRFWRDENSTLAAPGSDQLTLDRLTVERLASDSAALERWVSGKERNTGKEGLIYESSMRNGGKCVVLFKGQDISSETNGAWLVYADQSTYEITGVNFQHTLINR